MKDLTPRHINDAESDRRGVKDGWYAVNAVGKLDGGPFLNREECLSDIYRKLAAIDVYSQRKAN